MRAHLDGAALRAALLNRLLWSAVGAVFTVLEKPERVAIQDVINLFFARFQFFRQNGKHPMTQTSGHFCRFVFQLSLFGGLAASWIAGLEPRLRRRVRIAHQHLRPEPPFFLVFFMGNLA